MYCSNCGKKLSPDDYFCSNCGTPVTRQGLFNDEDDVHEDQFEETRLFTAEELGQYLNDVEEEPVSADLSDHADKDVSEIGTKAPQDRSSENEPAKKDDAAKAAAAAMAGAASAAGAFAGKFKGKLSEIKAKQAEKKQTAKAVSANDTSSQEMMSEADFEDPQLVSYPEEKSRPPRKNKKAAKPVSAEAVSFKKIAFPVIVLGLIIGLVIGLVIIQPWSSAENEDAAAEDVAAGVVLNIE